MKKLAGIRLEGDYLTLQRLHETLLKFANATPSQPKNDLLFELGYDIRHAFEGTRDVIAPPEHTPEIGDRFGVNIIWPTLLLQADRKSPRLKSRHQCAYRKAFLSLKNKQITY